MAVRFGVLGPVAAWADDGAPLALRGPRHRAVLARLLVARRRTVPVGLLADDLWGDDPPADPVAALRTFVAALRRALEPERRPRTSARLLVTDGPGYALRAAPDAVDAWRFERAVGAAAALSPQAAHPLLAGALDLWRGPAYAEVADAPWAAPEAARLAELRLHAVELHADAALALGRAAETAAALDAHTAEHPWREDAWRLLALALYRAGRRRDALAVLRRAAALLRDELGLDPGERLRRLEADILRQAPALDAPASDARPAGAAPSAPLPRATPAAPPEGARPEGAWPEDAPPEGARPEGAWPEGVLPGDARPEGARPGGVRPGDARPVGADTGSSAAQVWEAATASYGRIAASGPSLAAGARLESSVGVLRALAVTGGEGLVSARRHRAAAVAAAEQGGDPETTARVIGSFDVPAVWTRVDDPEQARAVVATAERALAALPPGAPAPLRARLLATVAVESRGTGDSRTGDAAVEAERLARELGDPALLAFALNARFMQCFHRAGLAPERDAVGTELTAIGSRQGLPTAEVLGHLVRLQARSALADFTGADRHAAAVDALSDRHGLPLAAVFTHWYRALRLAATPGVTAAAETAAYRTAATALVGAGMPGLEHGLLPLALLTVRLRRTPLGASPAVTDPELPGSERPDPERPDPELHSAEADFGPYRPWVRPLSLLHRARPAEARRALRELPDPPADLMLEAMWSLTARAALALNDRPTLLRTRTALAPARAELAGAGTGLITLGPVSAHLDALDAALEAPDRERQAVRTERHQPLWTDGT